MFSSTERYNMTIYLRTFDLKKGQKRFKEQAGKNEKRSNRA